MTGDEADELLGIVQRIGPVILSSAVNLADEAGTALRRAVGMMVADKNMVDHEVFAFAFAVCVDLARFCGATLVTMDRVRKAALKETPVGAPAIQTVLHIVRLTLATHARIIAATAFRSRDDVDLTATAINAAFTQTSEIAADSLDQGTYMALITLHGSVVQHLADRGRLLPRVVSYSFPIAMPSLRLSQRAYGTAKRHRDLINENKAVHPAFMPRDGKMLAV